MFRLTIFVGFFILYNNAFAGIRSRRWVFPEQSNSSTRNEGEYCETKMKSIIEAGLCKKLSNCSSLSRRLEKPTTCYYKNNEPIVCCPIVSSNIEAKSLRLQEIKLPGCGRKVFLYDTAGLSFVRKRRASSVAGGHEAIPNSWPWMIAVLKKSSNGKFQYHCGASLISTRYSLTAAHCFVGGRLSKNPRDYKLRVGAHNRSSGFDYTLQSIIIHDRYSQTVHYFDIALLKSNRQISISSNVLPVCLPPKSLKFPAQSRAVVTGWGDTSFGGIDSAKLQEASLLIFTNKRCNESYKKIAPTSSLPRGIMGNMICAGENSGGKDACQGDSGGPLVYLKENSWSIIGIVSFGYGCAQAGFPGVYTRISHFLDWIGTKTNNLDGAAQIT